MILPTGPYSHLWNEFFEKLQEYRRAPDFCSYDEINVAWTIHEPETLTFNGRWGVLPGAVAAYTYMRKKYDLPEGLKMAVAFWKKFGIRNDMEFFNFDGEEEFKSIVIGFLWMGVGDAVIYSGWFPELRKTTGLPLYFCEQGRELYQDMGILRKPIMPALYLSAGLDDDMGIVNRALRMLGKPTHKKPDGFPRPYLYFKGEKPFPGKYLVANLGSYSVAWQKYYPYWSDIINWIKTHSSYQIIQVGRANELHSPVRGCINAIGKTSLRQLGLLTQYAMGGIGPVSALLHLCQSVRVPYFCVSGGSENVGKFHRYRDVFFVDNSGEMDCGCCWDRGLVKTCSQLAQPARCMEGLSPETVISRLPEFLEQCGG